METISGPLIHFHFLDVSVSLRNRKTLKKFIVQIFKAENKKLAGLNYVFCNDRTLLEMNRKYLGHDFYTDILTFDLSATDAVNAEIYISIDRIRENASTFQVPISQELHRVIFHGILHLCGYNDDSNAQKKLMTTKEDLYLAKYNVFHVKHSA